MDTLQNNDTNSKSNSINKSNRKKAFSVVTTAASTEIDLYGGAENEKLLAPVPLGLHDEGVVLWSRKTESIVNVSFTKINNQAFLNSYCGDLWLNSYYRKIDQRTGALSIDYQAVANDIARKAGTLKYFTQSGRYATGCWMGEGGGLVINSPDFCVDHNGNDVERIDHSQKRSAIYTTKSKFSMPEFVSKDTEEDAKIVTSILKDLAVWKYVYDRETTGGGIVVGWLVSAVYCAALETRPSLWVTGVNGTGKSTLFRYISGLLGKGAISAESATAAGIRQAIEDSSVPAILDEFETSGTEQSVSKTKAIMKTLREAFSASSVTIMGTSGQTGKQYRQQYPFALFSVSSPVLEGADAGRIIRLRLTKNAGSSALRLPEHTKYSKADKSRFVWTIWRNWELYQSILISVREEYGKQEADADGREMDAWCPVIAGTILMLAIAMHISKEELPKHIQSAVINTLNSMREEIDASREQRRDHETVYNEIMDTKIRVEYIQHNDSSGRDGTRIETMTVGMALRKAEDDDEFADAALRMIGIKAKFKKDGISYTAIAVKNNELAKLMTGTRWAKDGSWSEPLKATPGCLQKSHPVRFSYTASKAVLIPSSSK